MANWYAYTGIGDPMDPFSYRLSSQKPACTIVGIDICAIYLNQTDSIPVGIDGVSTYIANALLTLTSQPTGVGIKRFVYVKSPIS